jgi:hypothetical protein
MHFVKYDDGPVKWHHFKVTTFWVSDKGTRTKFTPRPGATKTLYGRGNVAGTPSYTPHASSSSSLYGTAYGQTYYGTTGAYGTYQRPWTPYESPTLHAQTECSFHVVVDPRAVREGDRVVLGGNLAALGAWAGDGVPMVLHPQNTSLWSATVTLPYAAMDECVWGLFQFAYKIVTNDGGEIKEGGTVAHGRKPPLFMRFYCTSLSSNLLTTPAKYLYAHSLLLQAPCVWRTAWRRTFTTPFSTTTPTRASGAGLRPWAKRPCRPWSAPCSGICS